MVDFIGRFENLNNDLKTICENINVEYTPLPHKNKSTHKPYQEYTIHAQRFSCVYI